MATVLDFSVCQSNDCKYINFSELTGAYNASTNLTGWGAPNTPLGNAVKAELIITLTDGTIVTLDITLGNNGTVGTDDFPTTDCSRIYTVNSSMVGLSPATPLVSIPDGIYKFTYKVTLNDESVLTKTKTVLLTCTVGCGVSKLFAALPLCDCDCKDNEEFTNALFAKTMLDQLKYAGGCATSTTKINNILEKLSDFLVIVNSTCGCLDNSSSQNVNTV